MFTPILSSINKLFSSDRRISASFPRRRVPLRVESLEERQLPSGTGVQASPAAPVFAATAVSAQEIDLAWNSASGVNSYVIDDWSNGAWTPIGSVSGSSTGCSVTGLTAGTTYFFTIGAVNAAGAAWAANYESATTFPAAPSFTATASATAVNLTWNSVAGANGYFVDEWSNGSWQEIGSVTGGATSYAVNGVNANTTYYFLVGAANGSGTTWAASYQSVTTLTAAPTFTASTTSANQVTLTWNSVNGASSYSIEELSNGAWTQVGSMTAGSSTFYGYVVAGLDANTSYSFRIGAINAGGTSWADSASITTLQAPPPAPSFTASAISATQINLSWNSVADTDSYAIEEQINGVWKQIGSVSAGSTTYAVTGLSANTAYSFNVGAANSAGTTWAANSQSATTLQAPPPASGLTSDDIVVLAAAAVLSQEQQNVVPQTTTSSTGNGYLSSSLLAADSISTQTQAALQQEYQYSLAGGGSYSQSSYDNYFGGLTGSIAANGEFDSLSYYY